MAFSSGGQSFGKLEAPLDVESRKAGELALSSVALSKEAHPAADLGLGLGFRSAIRLRWWRRVCRWSQPAPINS